MWLAFTIQIPLFTILIERVKIQENQKPAVLRLGKAFESDRSRHPESLRSALVKLNGE